MKYFIIVGSQRTGSSALAEAISVHPHIASGWEWTQTIPPYRVALASNKALFKNDFLALDQSNREHTEKILKKQLNCFGYRRLFRSSSKWLFSPSLSITSVYERLHWHMNWFIENQVFIIHIVRSNSLGWLKSKAVAKKTGSYYGKPYEEGVQAMMNPKEAVKRIKAKFWLDDQLASLAAKTPYLQIQYEQFQKDNTEEAKRVIRFLGEDEMLLPQLSERMHLKKQSNKLDSELLVNYDEIKELLLQQDLLEYKKLKS